jgi:hypothetical protein
MVGSADVVQGTEGHPQVSKSRRPPLHRPTVRAESEYTVSSVCLYTEMAVITAAISAILLLRGKPTRHLEYSMLVEEIQPRPAVQWGRPLFSAEPSVHTTTGGGVTGGRGPKFHCRGLSVFRGGCCPLVSVMGADQVRLG